MGFYVQFREEKDEMNCSDIRPQIFFLSCSTFCSSSMFQFDIDTRCLTVAKKTRKIVESWRKHNCNFKTHPRCSNARVEDTSNFLKPRQRILGQHLSLPHKPRELAVDKLFPANRFGFFRGVSFISAYQRDCTRSLALTPVHIIARICVID